MADGGVLLNHTLFLLKFNLCMNSVRKCFIVALAFIAFTVLPALSFAQVLDPGCNPDDPLCPIDGGLSLLIAAGIGIGAKRAYDHKKKSVE